jgi:diguanylate cyclase (GGDEF)-like protein/PAS domain S-box-containing protein
MASILIVDDRLANREFLVTLLGYRNHRLFEASDGAEALELVRAQHPDLVIADVLMPTMDGYELVRQLRADPDTAATPVMFFTAHYHKHEAAALAKSCGVEQVIAKPCEPELILRAVDESLRHQPPHDATSVPVDFDQDHLRVITDQLSETADHLHESNARLSVLVDINLRLASEHDPGRLLKHVCPAARELIGARHAVLAVGPKKTESESHFVTCGMDAELTERLRLYTLNEGVTKTAFAARTSRRLVNPTGDPTTVGLPSFYPPVHSIVAAPVASLAHVYGWIWLTDKIGTNEFNAEDERLLAILGAQVGRIYENGSLYLQVHRHAAQLEEEIERRNRAQAALVQSEQRFRQVTENIRDVFFLIDADRNRILYISPAYEEIWGRSCASVYANPRSWAEAVHPEDQAATRENYRRGVLSGRFDYEYRITRPDGTMRWIESRGFPIHDDSGRVERIAGVATDITERKHAEIKIKRLNRVYAVLSGINALIVRADDRGELFREACRIAVESGKFPLAWIGLVDGARIAIPLAAWAGSESSRNKLAVAGSKLLDPGGIVHRVAEQQALIVNDIAIDHRIWLREEALASGLRSLVALPLCLGGNVVALFTLYSQHSGFFDADEMKLLLELAGDLSFALDHIQKAERLDYLADYDAITGLPNRNLLFQRLAEYKQTAASAESRFALLLFDLERFKNVNHNLGRCGGDELLCQVAQWLNAHVGSGSCVARIGADQFALVLPQIATEDEVTRFVESTLDAFLQHTFELNDTSLRVAAKVGVVLYPDDGTAPDTLFKNAEAALKKAKVSGDRYLFYAQRMTDTVAIKFTLEYQLRLAIENSEFVLHYQPKVQLSDGRLTGAEALIRWNDPRTGLVPPARFIPILEETGLIYEVGRWALRQVIDDYLRWSAAGLPAVRLAVNVSPLQLRHRDFITDISKAIGIAVNAAAGLELELTESLIMEDVAHSIDRLRAIRTMGVCIAIDDFGAGFSSLSYLAKLPVDSLKIDRAFITDMAAAPEGLSLVSTIINLGRSLKLKVVAEGVETEEQSRLLRLLSCDEMQGYVLSKPLPRDVFETTYLRGAAA